MDELLTRMRGFASLLRRRRRRVGLLELETKLLTFGVINITI